jgi:hypothetical protein
MAQPRWGRSYSEDRCYVYDANVITCIYHTQ